MYETGNIPQPLERYRHFKGNIYQIVCIATDSESDEQMVVYQALYGDYKVYVRPLDMFMSEVDHIKYPEVTQKYRFELIKTSGGYASVPVEAEAAHIPDDKRNDDAHQAPENRTSEQTGVLSPDVERFLDASTTEERFRILSEMKDTVTDDMIDIMSTAIDAKVDEGRIEKRYERLLDALRTRMQYETHRLR